jgi:hypothetical protein
MSQKTKLERLERDLEWVESDLLGLAGEGGGMAVSALLFGKYLKR